MEQIESNDTKMDLNCECGCFKNIHSLEQNLIQLRDFMKNEKLNACF
jgi:hypothetical protein